MVCAPNNRVSLWKVKIEDNGPLTEILSRNNWTTGNEILQDFIGTSEMKTFAQIFQDGDCAKDHMLSLANVSYDSIMEYLRKRAHGTIGKKILDTAAGASILITLMRSGKLINWTRKVNNLTIIYFYKII